MFGVFRAKNHDFMQKNLIFSNFRGAGHPQPLDLPLALKSKTKDLVGGATPQTFSRLLPLAAIL
jgi:hypothetical protein